MLVQGYDNMIGEEKGPLDKMYNFLLGLHSLVHTAKASSKAPVEAERGLFDGDVPQPSSGFLQTRNEHGACRLIRTACKAFAVSVHNFSFRFVCSRVYMLGNAHLFNQVPKKCI